MKSLIITLALALAPGIAAAEWSTIQEINDGHKMITTFKDDGDVRTSNAFKIGKGMWQIYDDRGNVKQVFDYSSDRDEDRDDD